MTIMKLETAPPVTEREFQRQVVELATIYRWRVYHPFLSKWSERGFPDLTMVRDERLVFAELKRQTGRLTDDQAAWIDRLGATAAEVYVWRPSDWDAIAQTLR